MEMNNEMMSLADQLRSTCNELAFNICKKIFDDIMNDCRAAANCGKTSCRFSFTKETIKKYFSEYDAIRLFSDKQQSFIRTFEQMIVDSGFSFCTYYCRAGGKDENKTDKDIFKYELSYRIRWDHQFEKPYSLEQVKEFERKEKQKRELAVLEERKAIEEEYANRAAEAKEIDEKIKADRFMMSTYITSRNNNPSKTFHPPASIPRSSSGRGPSSKFDGDSYPFDR